MNKRQAKRMAARMVAGLIRNHVGAGGLPMEGEGVFPHFSLRLTSTAFEPPWMRSKPRWMRAAEAILRPATPTGSIRAFDTKTGY
jgi:hypothetical protein